MKKLGIGIDLARRTLSPRFGAPMWFVCSEIKQPGRSFFGEKIKSFRTPRLSGSNPMAPK